MYNDIKLMSVNNNVVAATDVEKEDIQMTRENIFFIVGTSRSGSTLLQSMLNMHPHITIPPETHFFHSYRHLQYHFNKHNDIQQLIDYWYDNRTRIRDLNLPKKLVKECAEKLQMTTPIQLFDLHLTLYRLIRGKKVSGEKTPKHIRHIEEILHCYPKAKIISLFRDPRATANSEINAPFGSPSVIVSTKRWKEYVKIHCRLKEQLPPSTYLMIQYRDLISEPELTLRKITNLLGWNFEPRMLQYYQRNENEKGFSKVEKDWKNETFEPLKTNKNEKWKYQLSSWQVALIEKVADEWLHKIGYGSRAVKMNFFKLKFYTALDLGKSALAFLTNERDEGYREPGKYIL